jgi:F0F1-type ATP synthase membrane subunit b/b'
MADLKTEGTNLIKTLGAIAASFGVVWTFLEPMVEDYIEERIKVVQEADKKLIQELQDIVDQDYNHSKAKRNEIIRELQRIHYGIELKTEE